jgi:hypothetical protein
MALRSVHPLRLQRLAHTLTDLAPAPATHDLATLEALFTPAPTDEQVALHAIREEHTAGADAKLRFTADDLAEPTFALAEYWFVADPINGLKSAGLVEWPPFHSRRAVVPVPSEPYHPTTLSAATARTIPRKGKTWAQLSPAVQEVNARLAELRVAYPKGAKRRWRTIARALGWSLTADDCLRRARFKAEHYNARPSVADSHADVVWDKETDARLSELIDDTSRATPKRWRYIARTLGGNTSADDSLRRARCSTFVEAQGDDARAARFEKRIAALPSCVDTSAIALDMRKLADSRNELAIFRASARAVVHALVP